MMRVVFYHVGKGDLSLVLLPSGDAMMVDCYKADEVADAEDGETDPFFEQIEATILEHRLTLGRKNLKLALLAEQEKKKKVKVPIAVLAVTHADKDHILARKRLKARFDIGFLIDSGREYDDPSDAQKDYLLFRQEMQKDGKHKAFRRASYNIWPDSGASIDVLCPNRDIDKAEGYNNQCLILRADYMGKQFLFTGDSPVDDWANNKTGILKLHPAKVKSEVLNVSHHGSRTFFTPPGPREKGQPDYTKDEFDTRALEAIAPSSSFITCSDDEDADHPHAIALEVYQELTNLHVKEYVRKSHVVLSRESHDLHHVVDTDGRLYMRTSRTRSDSVDTGDPGKGPHLVGTVSSRNGYKTDSGIWVSRTQGGGGDEISFEVKAKGEWTGTIMFDWWVLNNGQGSDQYHREYYTMDSKDRKKRSSWSRSLDYDGVHIMHCHAENEDGSCWANWCVLVCREACLPYANRWLEIFPGCLNPARINPRWF